MNQINIDGIVQDRIYDKTTHTGKRVVNFTIKNSYEGPNGPLTTYQQVVAWEPSIQIKSGLSVFIQGRLQNRSWQDKKSGQTRYITEVVASSVRTVLETEEPVKKMTDEADENQDKFPAW